MFKRLGSGKWCAGEALEYGVYRSFRKSKVGDVVGSEDGAMSKSPAWRFASSRQSDWACLFNSKSVGVAVRSVKKEQARWEKWDGVRWPWVKSDVRREQENGGVWVEAGMDVAMLEG